MMEGQIKIGLLLFLLNHFGDVSGRTRVQKMLYLTNLIGWDAFKDYRFYQYGPYSQWVKRGLDLLVQKKLIDEKQQEANGDRVIYRYHITENGSEYLQRIGLEPPELVEKTKSLFEKLRPYQTDDLEIMTSLYHIRKSDPEVGSDERLVKFIELYKPRFRREQIEKNLEVFQLMDPFTQPARA